MSEHLEKMEALVTENASLKAQVHQQVMQIDRLVQGLDDARKALRVLEVELENSVSTQGKDGCNEPDHYFSP